MSTTFKYELLHLSNTHNSIADWLIANPGKGQQGKCAAVFGISQAWLSTLIHQDAFAAMLKFKQGQTFEKVIIPLHEKMAGVAHRGVEKLGEILDTSDDDRLVKEITKDMLHGLGYGASTAAPGTVINNTQNTLNIDSTALAEARERRSQHYRSDDLESSSNTQEPGPQTEAPQLSHSEEAEVGKTRELRAEHVNVGTEVHGSETPGSKV